MRYLQNATIIAFVLMIILYGGVMLYDRFVVDTTAPTIRCDTLEIAVSVADSEDALLAGVTAQDDRDGDLTEQVQIKNVSQLITDNTAQVTYIVFDSANNMATMTRTVCYTDYEKPRLSMDKPLNYTVDEDFQVLDRLTATDVLDGDISDSICVISQNILKEAGTYHITVQATNSLGDTTTVPLKLVVRENGVQEMLRLDTYLLYLEKGASFDPQQHITLAKTPDGRALPVSEVNIDAAIDVNTVGTYHVRYSLTSQNQTYVVYLTVVVY